MFKASIEEKKKKKPRHVELFPWVLEDFSSKENTNRNQKINTFKKSEIFEELVCGKRKAKLLTT